MNIVPDFLLFYVFQTLIREYFTAIPVSDYIIGSFPEI